MADTRLLTFLKLCELMNYRKTASALNMTQPAVTQHIHYLEEEYGGKLFTYTGRMLKITQRGQQLAQYAKALLYNEKVFKEQLLQPKTQRLAIGATKTIGDYTMESKILELLGREHLNLELRIDNTENLLALLNALKLDLLLVEGFIDKNSYGHKLIKEEELVGICAPSHPLAGKEVPVEALFGEHLILREQGSGTRAVFENYLEERGYSEKCFRKASQISSFKLIEKAVAAGQGISFVYESIPKSNPSLSIFRIQGSRIMHEFNFVFLKNTRAEQSLKLLEE